MSETHPKTVDPANRRGRKVYEAWSASSVGLEFGISVIIGILIGRWLDREAGTEPWLTIVFMCLGFAAGVRGILRAWKRADRAAAREREEQKHG